MSRPNKNQVKKPISERLTLAEVARILECNESDILTFGASGKIDLKISCPDYVPVSRVRCYLSETLILFTNSAIESTSEQELSSEPHDDRFLDPSQIISAYEKNSVLPGNLIFLSIDTCIDLLKTREGTLSVFACPSLSEMTFRLMNLRKNPFELFIENLNKKPANLKLGNRFRYDPFSGKFPNLSKCSSEEPTNYDYSSSLGRFSPYPFRASCELVSQATDKFKDNCDRIATLLLQVSQTNEQGHWISDEVPMKLFTEFESITHALVKKGMSEHDFHLVVDIASRFDLWVPISPRNCSKITPRNLVFNRNDIDYLKFLLNNQTTPNDTKLLSSLNSKEPHCCIEAFMFKTCTRLLLSGTPKNKLSEAAYDETIKELKKTLDSN